MLEALVKNVAKKNIHLNAHEIGMMQPLFRSRDYRKGQYILQQGDIARRESFIISGLVRMYLVDLKGQEHVLYFANEDCWIGDLYSHYAETPSNYNIECVEPTQVLQISKDDIENLCSKIPKMNVFFRHLYRNSIIAHEYRTTSVLSKTTLQRYQEFIDKYPHIEQRVPLIQIASYLGITPQSLSRIRKLNAQG